MRSFEGSLSSYLKTADSEWYNQRLYIAFFCIMAAFAILFVRLFYLQVIAGDEFRRLSENNCIRLQTIDPQRGLIFDRNGTLLVNNRPSFDLGIILKDAKPVENTINRLSSYTSISFKELKEKIARTKCASYKPIILQKDIGRDLLARIEAHKFDLPGVVVDVKPRRHYIYRYSGTHIIGYLGEINSDELKAGQYTGCKSGDFIGRFGVEKAQDDFFRGKRGGRQVEVNAAGQVIRVLKTVDSKPGHNIYLTIDHVLQKKAEDLLNNRAGAVLAMIPSSGEILVMASSPSFDQNSFVSGMSHKEWDSLITNPFRPMENKAIQGEYPPASTYKIITAIAGLEEGVIDENTTFFCPGHYRYGNRVYRCWKRAGHGSVDVVKALAESCDVFFYQVGQKLGIDRLAWYAKACGLGSYTGINLDHEADGLVPTANWKKQRTGVSWQGGETLSVAIGQGYNLATPLQMLILISAVANGGTIYKPLIIKTIETAEGVIVRKSAPLVAGKLPVSAKVMELVKKGLWKVVNDRKGTAWGYRLDDIEICGKTGTAQVVSRKKDDSLNEEERSFFLKPHAWFVAYAPSVDPEIAVAVIVEHGEHGSSTAAPIASEVIRTYFEGMTEETINNVR
ncbi:MAG: penicillin-binding protein 2 [Deltaproteobacteria bacterium]|nr:penicillin-binding protein 2 [Deltaproteobacteria bacterium]